MGAVLPLGAGLSFRAELITYLQCLAKELECRCNPTPGTDPKREVRAPAFSANLDALVWLSFPRDAHSSTCVLAPFDAERQHARNFRNS